jgi:hypothetical protein
VRALTDEEVVLVKRWQRRRRIGFWIFLPVAVLLTLVMGAIAVTSGLDGQVFFAVMSALVTVMIPAVAYTQWKTAERGTKVRRLSGVFAARTESRSLSLYVGTTFVEVASRELRHKLVFGERCTVDVLEGMPPLVIAVLE